MSPEAAHAINEARNIRRNPPRIYPAQRVGMTRLSLYLIGVYGLLAAGMVYINRRNSAPKRAR